MSQTSRNNRALISIATMLFVIFSGIAFAEEPKGEKGFPKRNVKRAIKLKPHAKAEVIVPDFHLLYFWDGTVTIKGSGSGDLNSVFEGYDFDINPTDGTYMTRRLSETEILERLQASTSSEGLQPIVEESYAYGPYRVHAFVQTRDPIDIVLTETSTRLEWSVTSTGNVSYIYGGDYCWAEDYSSAGTTWYREYCDYGDLWWSTDGSLCNDTDGWYYNYDYWDDNLVTNAWGHVFVCGQNNGGYRTGYQVDFSGEHSGFLSGAFFHRRY